MSQMPGVHCLMACAWLVVCHALQAVAVAQQHAAFLTTCVNVNANMPIVAIIVVHIATKCLGLLHEINLTLPYSMARPGAYR